MNNRILAFAILVSALPPIGALAQAPSLTIQVDHPTGTVSPTLYGLMTEEINQKYIAKIDGSGVPVNCGTCHRGHMGPEPFPGSSVPALQDPAAAPPSSQEPAPQ